MIRKFLTAINISTKSYQERDIEKYSNEALQYKLAKKWDLAGQLYEKAGKVYISLKEENDACMFYREAIKCYKYIDCPDYVRLCKVLADLYKNNNRFYTAGTIYRSLAEREEKNNISNAINSYIEASDCFQIDDKESSHIQMMIKIADLSTILKDYKRAVNYYDMIIVKSMDTDLRKYHINKYILIASLCRILTYNETFFNCIDQCKEEIDNYVDIYFVYESSKECDFINNIFTSLENDDIVEFTNCVFTYNKLYKLDEISCELLLKLKNILNSDYILDDHIDLR